VPGQGSAFTVTVPFDTAAAGAHAWPRLGLEPTPPMCVLDLEGDATFETASRYFAAAGYTVDRARDGSFADAALICVDAERLRMLALDRGAERKPLVIAVVDFGDAQVDALVADGVADAVLTRPLLRADVQDLLGRIVAGGPLVSTAKHAGVQPALQFPGLKVLVADDSEVNREVATAALTRLGASVHTVDSGAQAIAAAREGAFDVVLMDGSMPDIDGFAAAGAIREEEERDGRQRLPIVALTAHVIGKAATAWREAGMDDIVYKPFTLAQLGACLQRLFPTWSEAASSEPASSAMSSVKAGAEAEMLDARVLRELETIAGSAGGGFLQRIFTLYLDHAPRIHAELARAIEAADADAAVRAAHALKSMSHNVGARRLAAAAEAIERKEYETGAPAADELEALTRLLDATMAAVRARLEAGATSQAPAAGLQLRQA
jgi:CheY-like chemotaxis protein